MSFKTGFGFVGGACFVGAWMYRLSQETKNRTEVKESIEEESPLAPGEVKELRLLNRVSVDDFRRFAGKAQQRKPLWHVTDFEQALVQELKDVLPGGKLGGSHHFERARLTLNLDSGPSDVRYLLALYSPIVEGEVDDRLDMLLDVFNTVLGPTAPAPGDGPSQIEGSGSPPLPTPSVAGTDAESGQEPGTGIGADKEIESGAESGAESGRGAEMETGPGDVEAATRLDADNIRVIEQTDVEELVAALATTWQLPAKYRVKEIERWPLVKHGVRTPAEHLDEAFRVTKIQLDADVPVTYEEARALLVSKGVCVWGECVGKRR